MKFLIRNVIMLMIARSICFCQTGAVNNVINVSGFDISKDDNYVLMACRDKICQSIYLMNCETNKARVLVQGTKNLDYFNPQYSQDGKKIIFIGKFNKGVDNTAVFIANSNGTEVKQITKGNEIINQAIFSNYDSSIVMYIKANTYENYSPFAPKQTHKMDVYSVNLNDTSINRITHMDAYAIWEISELDSANLLMHLPAGLDGGMFLYNKNTRNFNRIVPANDPRKKASQYYTPKYSEQFNMLGIIAPYELYLMDMNTKMASLVYRPGPTEKLRHVDDFCFFHSTKKILFEIDKGGLFSVNFDGTDLKRIDIKLE